jgi:putative endonuclease
MNHYIKYHCIDAEVRLDIITVVGIMGEEPEIEHIIDVAL